MALLRSILRVHLGGVEGHPGPSEMLYVLQGGSVTVGISGSRPSGGVGLVSMTTLADVSGGS